MYNKQPNQRSFLPRILSGQQLGDSRAYETPYLELIFIHQEPRGKCLFTNLANTMKHCPQVLKRLEFSQFLLEPDKYFLLSPHITYCKQRLSEIKQASREELELQPKRLSVIV